MTTIHAFGDSFVAADQDERHDDLEYREYLKYNVSFAALIAEHLNVPLVNCAEYGSGNYPQIDRLILNLQNEKIKSDDIVLFGFTSSIRGRSASVKNPWLHFFTTMLILFIMATVTLYGVYLYTRP